MSQRNADVFARAIRALNARDVAGLAQLTADDVEWRPALTAGGAVEGAVYRGTDGLARYFADLDAEFADTDIKTVSVEPVGDDRVLYRGRVTARGRASGVELDVPIWAVWEFRDGKIARGTAFLSEAEALGALEALGPPD